MRGAASRWGCEMDVSEKRVRVETYVTHQTYGLTESELCEAVADWLLAKHGICAPAGRLKIKDLWCYDFQGVHESDDCLVTLVETPEGAE